MREKASHGAFDKEFKPTQGSLLESEECLRAIAQNSHEAILIVDDNFKLTYVNDEFCHTLGYSKEDVIGQDFREFLDEDSRSMIETRYVRRQRGEEVPSRYEFTVFRKDGVKRLLEIKSTVIRNHRGKVQTVAQILDVTEKKSMEQSRKRFEERLSALNTYGQSVNMARTSREIFTQTLHAMEKTLGFEHGAFLIVDKGKLKLARQVGYPTPLYLELPLDGTKKGITVRAATTRTPVLVPDTRQDKDYVEGIHGIRSELAVPVVIEGRVLGVLNVESRKTGAFDIRDLQLLTILASHASTAISNLEKRREIEKRSNQLTSLLKSSTKIMSSTDLRQRLKTIAEAIGELGWRRVVISVRDQNMDIVNPKDIVTAGLTDEEIAFLWDNRTPGRVWKERFGPEYSRFKIGEFYHLPWNDPWVRKRFSDSTVPSKLPSEAMVDWDPQDLLYAPLRLADGRTVGVLSIDDPVDGKRPTKESLAPLELFLHQAAVAVENAQLIRSLNQAREQLKADAEKLEFKVEERTRELKKSQEQLLKAQRLAAIGELASMVGHDLRNPLTGIAGAAYYLRTKLASSTNEKAKEMLELIEKDIEYANKIIMDLLEYSKDIHLELSLTTPKAIMGDVLSLVELPKDIEVRDQTRNTPRLGLDREKMKRVFVNMVNNAVDAMAEGGKLYIESKKAGEKVEFAFIDTGTGIPKDILEEIWSPFFTTKAKGMGLGLPICRRIVEAHGGDILVESTVGKGTIFRIIIPLKPKQEGGEKIWIHAPESSLLMTMKP